VTLHFTTLCSIANSKYNVLTASNTVEISFRVVSNKTRSMREFTTVVAFDALKKNAHHQDTAWA
jgi:hypothetical protein